MVTRKSILIALISLATCGGQMFAGKGDKALSVMSGKDAERFTTAYNKVTNKKLKVAEGFNSNLAVNTLKKNKALKVMQGEDAKNFTQKYNAITNKNQSVAPKKGMSTLKKVGLGLAGTAAVAGLGYAAYKNQDAIKAFGSQALDYASSSRVGQAVANSKVGQYVASKFVSAAPQVETPVVETPVVETPVVETPVMSAEEAFEQASLFSNF